MHEYIDLKELEDWIKLCFKYEKEGVDFDINYINDLLDLRRRILKKEGICTQEKA